LISQIKSNISSNISVTSVVRYAKLGFDEGKRDATIIGTISLLGVIILLFAVFRNIFTILAGLVPIFCGLIFAFGALFLFSPEINGIALSMGACFVGIVIDYSLHYLVQNEENPKIRLKSIISGLSISVFSTIAGFCAFFFTPVAGLRHIAIMSVFGLLGAYFSVIILLPHIKSANKKLPIKIPKNLVPKIPNPVKIIIIIAVITVSFFGILKVKHNDDIKNFRSPAPNLEAEEAILRKYTGKTESNKFLAVLGKNDEEMLNNLSEISLSLNSLKSNKIIENYRSIGQYMTSRKQSEKNRENLLNLLDGEVLNYLKKLGFKDSVLQNLITEIPIENYYNFLSEFR
jgi:predicted exporter